MSIPIHAPGLTDGVIPPRFGEALETFRGAMARCEAAGIPSHSAVAAALVDLMPRLVAIYGAGGVADVLGTLAVYVAQDEDGVTRQ
ncbi:hypothetical protein [Azospirillum sp. B4]|uniref:hypothetical protein n=1 Tax=Azospirillum sp. B4 TaxID=95605 RepID=UPI00034CE7FC|nr:hypothetical protein [Azospirillum sp. B4]